MKNQTIAVIDYGMGNLRSVAKALKFVAPDDNILITGNPDDINNADKIVFPGVGAVSSCMNELSARDLIPVVKKASLEKPFLGICLGMQLLFDHSEENNGINALKILNGTVLKFQSLSVKIPHMGWNNVKQTVKHPLWHKIKDQSQFYFVHSYFVSTDDDLISGVCEYEKIFTASIFKDNIFATQFHPEKSQTDGLQLLKNFSSWNGEC